VSTTSPSLPTPATAATVVIGAAAAVWLLREAAPVLQPLTVAFLLAALLRPLPRSARASLGPRWEWLGTLGASVVPVLAVAAVGATAVFAASEVPDAQQTLTEATDAVTQQLRGLGLPSPSASSLGGAVAGMLTDVLSQVASAGGGFVLAVFLVLLGLEERRRWPTKLGPVLGEEALGRLSRAWDTLSLKLRVFVAVRALTGVISGGLTTAWLFLVGADQPVLWGGVMFLLNFVPNLGSILGGIPPMLTTYLSAGLGPALAAGAGLLAVEQVVGNYIDPKLQGRSLRLSTLVVLTTVGGFTWLWGGLGALVAVPCLLAATSLAEQLPSLRPFARLVRSDADAAPLHADLDRTAQAS